MFEGLRRLFGGSAVPPAPASVRPKRDVATLVSRLRVPAVELRAAEDARSHFGGYPQVPAGFDWPARDRRPLAFLASLALEEVQRALPIGWLPPEGSLLFFFDAEGWFKGPSPDPAVIFVPPDVPTHAAIDVEAQCLPRGSMECVRIDTLPHYKREPIPALDLTDAESDDYGDLCDGLRGDGPSHQIGGFPNIVQTDDMEQQCHKIAVQRGWESSGPSDWRLLLQLDTDESLGLTAWGDCGIAYFWVREMDARRKDFSRVQTFVQFF